MYFQPVETQVLSTQGHPDVFNLHRLTAEPDLILEVDTLLLGMCNRL